MSTAHILITGAAGYLGGTVLDVLCKTVPDCQYSVLVRTTEQSQAISKAHPGVSTIVGDLSDKELVTASASTVDGVINCAGDDNPDVLRHLIAGMAANPKPTKGTLLHVSGVTCLVDPANPGFGHPSTKVYSDVDDKEELVSLPVDRHHVAIDQVVMGAHATTGVRTMILSSCQIAGNGTGACKKHSFGHGLVQAVMARGRGFVIEGGENIWSWVGVADVAAAIAFLLGKVMTESSELGYGLDGYYMVEAGQVRFRDQVQAVATKLKGLGKIETDAIDNLTVAQATEIHPYASFLWGVSPRCKADRLRALGWTPKGTDWKAVTEEMVDLAAAAPSS